MAFIQITFPFFMYMIFSAYLFSNIQKIGEGSINLNLLVISIVIGISLFVIQVLKERTVYIYKSFFFLILFFTYILFRITLDIGEISEIKSFLIGTTGGIVLFYILGALISIALIGTHDIIFNSDQAFKIFNLFFFVSLLVMSFFLFETLIDISSKLRGDLFLIKDLKGAYQRPGAFLLINFILFSVIYNYVVVVNSQKKLIRSKAFLFMIFLIYLIDSLGAMYLSQMFGSNNTFVSIGGLLFATLTFHLLMISEKVKYFLYSSVMSGKNIILGVIGKKLITSILLGILFLIVILFASIYYLNIDISKFRLFGYGSGEMITVTGRISTWNNFPTQLNYSPLFGNIDVDRLTTGEGKYVHSFIATLLTHLGFLGFIIFFSYLFLTIKEKINSTESYGYKRFIDNSTALYSLLIFSGIFLIASVGVFITWVPLWFLLGVVFTPIAFKNKGSF